MRPWKTALISGSIAQLFYVLYIYKHIQLYPAEPILPFSLFYDVKYISYSGSYTSSGHIPCKQQTVHLYINGINANFFKWAHYNQNSDSCQYFPVKKASVFCKLSMNRKMVKGSIIAAVLKSCKY